MQKTTFLIVLQGILIVVQMVNAQIGVISHDATVTLVVGAIAAGFQFVVQHLGNVACPPESKEGVKDCSLKDS